MAKNSNSLTAFAGHFGSVSQELSKDLETEGTNVVEVLAALAQAKNRSVITQLAKLVASVVKPVVETVQAVVLTVYAILFDHRKSIAELIAEGKYDWVNSDITEARFPKFAACCSSSTHKTEIELVHLGLDLSTEKVLAELDAKGFRPATIYELLHFGAKYPDVQREFPIVALGSVAQVYGWRHVACLDRLDSERYLILGWTDFGWSAYYRFAAVRKSA